LDTGRRRLLVEAVLDGRAAGAPAGRRSTPRRDRTDGVAARLAEHRRAPSARVAEGVRTFDSPPREFALLEHLVRQGDFVSSKNDLLAEVWGPDFVGDPNIVEVYVRYLRKKLDRDGDESVIETVRGIGYRVSDHA
jgi:DNA-binding response OmpR family regulator